ncbi:dual specificity phosphatase 29-like [Spea bombifrons]|uniref:dual specificity phosphatase 29-like n=1 Tax=Spea bombifrons TaxID=233779 RepID=UPI002349B3CA|nr:dual specificity phosphatase 29-like [Spea bombifrons]
MRRLCRSPPSVLELETLLEAYKGGFHHVDQVFPNLYLGDVVIAGDKEKLKKMGVTHILNVAHCSWECRGDSIDYGPHIQYYGITAEDCPQFNISRFLRPGAQFIHKAMSTPNGKILVHCVLGKSRSATLVLAYLMIYQRFTLEEAVRHVSRFRCISPNRGFLEQLRNLETDLQHGLWGCHIL